VCAGRRAPARILPAVDPTARRAYLDLLKQVLTRAFVLGEGRSRGRRRRFVALAMTLLAGRGLMVGGDCVIDDYGALRAPFDDLRAKHRVAEEIQTVHWTGAFWRRERA
jgi:hypothetical protein